MIHGMVLGHHEVEPTVRILGSELVEVLEQVGTTEGPVGNDQVPAHERLLSDTGPQAGCLACLSTRRYAPPAIV